jgi:hypothetical protein
MEAILLAPGPSMSMALADSVRGGFAGVVSNSFELAPWADFLAAQDRSWWHTHPQAKEFAGRKFTGNRIKGIETVEGSATNWNSGVLALQSAVQLGATRILLYGFDMHGTHFFGPYTNGLSNTKEIRRKVHLRQYEIWAKSHKGVEVINCTPGSALKCFPFEKLACAA